MCESVTCLSIALLQASKADGHLQKAWLPHQKADGHLHRAWLPHQKAGEHLQSAWLPHWKASRGPMAQKVKRLCNTFCGQLKAPLAPLRSAEQRSPVSWVAQSSQLSCTVQSAEKSSPISSAAQSSQLQSACLLWLSAQSLVALWWHPASWAYVLAAPWSSLLQCLQQLIIILSNLLEKEKKRKDYTFRRQFNEKPSMIPGCPGIQSTIQCTSIHAFIQSANALKLSSMTFSATVPATTHYQFIHSTAQCTSIHAFIQSRWIFRDRSIHS